MEPIINPWVIYLFSVACNVSFAACLISVICGTGAIICGVVSLVEGHTTGKKAAKRAAICAAGALLVAVVIPDRNTMIAMIVANEVTEDRISEAGEFASGVREAIKADIIEIIQAVEDEN